MSAAVAAPYASREFPAAADVDGSGTHTLFGSGQQVQVVRTEGSKTLVRTGPKQQVWVKSEFVEQLPSQPS